jgi:hypothetical protein
VNEDLGNEYVSEPTGFGGRSQQVAGQAYRVSCDRYDAFESETGPSGLRPIEFTKRLPGGLDARPAQPCRFFGEFELRSVVALSRQILSSYYGIVRGADLSGTAPHPYHAESSPHIGWDLLAQSVRGKTALGCKLLLNLSENPGTRKCI